MMAANNDVLLKHLEFIQLTIIRMAGNSFIIKGWAVTLVATVLALTTAEKGGKFGWISLMPAIIFWGLDAYYLRQERLFRKLYDHVRENPKENADFSLDTKPMEKRVSRWLKVCISKTIFWFYMPLTVVAGVVSHYISK